MTTQNYPLEDFLNIKTSVATSFSPDGKRVIIFSNDSGTFQLYVANSDGSDRQQLTDFDDNVDFGVYSPVNHEIVFGLSKAGNENAQLYLMDVNTKEYRQLTNKPEARFNWGNWSRDGKFIAFSSNERNGVDFDIYTMDIQTGEIKCVFQQGGWCSSQGFSPSGKYLAVDSSNNIVSNDLYLIDLSNNSYELIASEKDETINIMPKWLPDESGFFFSTNYQREFIALAFYDMKSKSTKYVMESEWDIGRTAMTRNGKYLAISTNKDGYGSLDIYAVNGLKKIESKSIPKGASYGYNWSKDGRYLIVNVGSPTSLTSSWIWSREKDEVRQITKATSRLPEDIFIAPELIHYKSFDGLEIPAFIYKPDNLKDAEKLPVIINIHGGPEGQSRADFSPLTQYLLQAGYAVVFPNVRGSTGYGKKYVHMDDVEKRMDSVADLVSLHDYLSKQVDLDSNRTILLGGSYGGFMVLAGLAFYPELWAGGVDLVGISNFVTFLENTAPYRRALREAEYGSLKRDKDFLHSISPINFADKIKAPLLIIHGKNDPRVPLSEAEQIHSKLREQGNKVEMIVYADEGHGISKLKNRLDLWPRVVDFLDEIVS